MTRKRQKQQQPRLARSTDVFVCPRCWVTAMRITLNKEKRMGKARCSNCGLEGEYEYNPDYESPAECALHIHAAMVDAYYAAVEPEQGKITRKTFMFKNVLESLKSITEIKLVPSPDCARCNHGRYLTESSGKYESYFCNIRVIRMGRKPWFYRGGHNIPTLLSCEYFDPAFTFYTVIMELVRMRDSLPSSPGIHKSW